MSCIEEFKEISTADLRETEENYEIYWNLEKDIDVRELEGEFINYCIGWMKQNAF